MRMNQQHKNIIDPLNRIEGDMAIEITVDQTNKITDARALGFVYRGFENIFIGKRPFDAMRLSQRSCGVCPISHGTAGAQAIEAAANFEIPKNAKLVRDIVLGSNIIVSHTTHFYFMWGPDMVNDRYKSHPLYPEIKKRFDPLKSQHLKDVLTKARIPLHTVVAIFGGKFPHPMHAVPGGVTCVPKQSDINKTMSIFAEVKDFIEKDILNGTRVEDWLKVKSAADVLELLKNEQFANSDVGVFIRFSLDNNLHKLGEGTANNFLSFGFGRMGGEKWLFKPGYVEKGAFHTIELDHITEDTSHAYYADESEWRNPINGLTDPVPKKQGAYSWIKSARYFGNSVEVGPLARQIVNGDPLMNDLVRNFGVNTFTRTVARLHECLLILPALIKWTEEIDLLKPFYYPFKDVDFGKGVGLVEAPRGALSHWVVVENSAVKRYQIITPTTWNASPEDSNGARGAIEKALIGVKLASQDSILEAGHIVRSFDPCISCSIHAVGKSKERIFIEHTQ